MKHYFYLFAMFSALFIFACGEVGGTDSSSDGGGNPSPTPTPGPSSSSNENSVCQGKDCCNGMPFDNKTNFCYSDQLYPLCGGNTYNPYEEGCFENKRYPKCSIASTRGTCVHNTLLRCRQEGPDETYIKDPIKGMKCEANGKIVGKTKDPRSNREYEIAQIGDQIWLAENLNYTGPDVSYSTCYGNNPSNCDIYGRLYDWASAMGLPDNCNYTDEGCPPVAGFLWGGICPPDFYMARNEDWKILVDYAGGDSIAASRLKSATGWGSNGNGTDSYGFNALPGGYYYALQNGFTEGPPDNSRSDWWVDTQHPKPDAYYWSMIASDTEVRNYFQSKGPHLAYVRCLHYFGSK